MLEFTYVMKKMKKNPLIFVRSTFILSFIMLFLSSFLTDIFLPGINQRELLNNSNFQHIEYYNTKKQGSIISADATAYSEKSQLVGGINYYNKNINVELFITSDKAKLIDSYYCPNNIIQDKSNGENISVFLSFNCVRELNLKIGDIFTIEYDTSKEPYHFYYDAKLTGILRPKYGDNMEHSEGICFIIGNGVFLKSLDDNNIKYKNVIFSNKREIDKGCISSKSKAELISHSYNYRDISSSKIIVNVVPVICILLQFFVFFREAKHFKQLIRSDICIFYTLGLSSKRCNFIIVIITLITIVISSLISLLLLVVLTQYLLKMYIDIFIIIMVFIIEIICICIFLLINKVRIHNTEKEANYERSIYPRCES